MGFSHQRGAAARTVLRARATGDQQAIDDAEEAVDYYLDSEDLDSYIAEHYPNGLALAVAESQPPPVLRREIQPYIFTASNGMEFTLRSDGTPGGPNPGMPGWDEAMLELFEHDHEVQLFTWRWPTDENFVVMRNEKPDIDRFGHRWAYCWDIRWIEEKIRGENYGKSWYCSDRSAPAPAGELSAHAASHAYFDTIDVPGYTRPQKMGQR